MWLVSPLATTGLPVYDGWTPMVARMPWMASCHEFCRSVPQRVYYTAGEYDRSMEWVVTLSGGAHALEELSKEFDTPDLSIRRENGEFNLRSKGFGNLTSHEEVQESVTKILPALNGATKLAALGPYTPITTGSISRINDDGTRHAYITMTSSIVVSATCSVTVIHADGTIEEDRPAAPVVTWFELSKRDARVKWALRLIENDFETWPGLYKIYEVIEEDIGYIPRKGWCTETELKRFKRTANSPEALGVHARHGKMSSPPPDPVSLSSAKSLIRKLLDNWFEEKRAQYNL